MHENDISKLLLDCAFKIHKEVGPGLLESVYEELLAYELMKNGASIKRQVGIPMTYETIKMEIGFRVDLIVDNKQSSPQAARYFITPAYAGVYYSGFPLSRE
jgi:hypothetical protein